MSLSPSDVGNRVCEFNCLRTGCKPVVCQWMLQTAASRYGQSEADRHTSGVEVTGHFPNVKQLGERNRCIGMLVTGSMRVERDRIVVA
jgi:hypothetical protein